MPLLQRVPMLVCLLIELKNVMVQPLAPASAMVADYERRPEYRCPKISHRLFAASPSFSQFP